MFTVKNHSLKTAVTCGRRISLLTFSENKLGNVFIYPPLSPFTARGLSETQSIYYFFPSQPFLLIYDNILNWICQVFLRKNAAECFCNAYSHRNIYLAFLENRTRKQSTLKAHIVQIGFCKISLEHIRRCKIAAL